MYRHDVFMHVDLLDHVPRSGPHRRKIMDFIRSLHNHPHTPGDFTDQDSSLRDRQVKILGDYAIIYWLDAPIQAVMVVDIRRADS